MLKQKVTCARTLQSTLSREPSDRRPISCLQADMQPGAFRSFCHARWGGIGSEPTFIEEIRD